MPFQWKEFIIVYCVIICKPGKDPNLAESYRPIALTSHVGKIMEKMINETLVYYLETRELKCYQSGFRKGRSTIDPVLLHCTAHVNKESVVAVFFNVEKAYDMMWKEGLLIN